MLEKVRNPFRAKTIVAYIIFGAICLVFVFLGIGPGGMPLGRGGSAVVVNGHRISTLDVNERLRYEERRLLGQIKGLSAARRRQMSEVLRSRIQNSLLQAELASQGAVKEGLVVSQLELQEAIVKIPQFQENKKFKPSLYQDYLSARRINAAKFEKDIEKDLRVQKLQQSFGIGAQPSLWEVGLQAETEEWKLDISFVAFHEGAFKKDQGTIKMKEIQQQVAESGSASEALKKVETFVKKNSLKWESTGLFSLASSEMPVLGQKDEILEKALSLEKGLAYKGLLPADGKYYFIRLKNIRRDKPQKNGKKALSLRQIFNHLNSVKAQLLFSNWLKKEQEKAKIIFASKS